MLLVDWLLSKCGSKTSQWGLSIQKQRWKHSHYTRVDITSLLDESERHFFISSTTHDYRGVYSSHAAWRIAAFESLINRADSHEETANKHNYSTCIIRSRSVKSSSILHSSAIILPRLFPWEASFSSLLTVDSKWAPADNRLQKKGQLGFWWHNDACSKLVLR